MKPEGKGQGGLEGEGLEVGVRPGDREKAGEVTGEGADTEGSGRAGESCGGRVRWGPPDSRPCQGRGRGARCQGCPSPSSSLHQAAN